MTMLLLCLLLVTQLRLSVLVEASVHRNTTAWTETAESAIGAIVPGWKWNNTAWNETVDSDKGGTMPGGAQNGTLSEETEDDEDRAVEGSADGDADEGSQIKDGNTITAGTIIIICSVFGVVVLLVTVGVMLSYRKRTTEQGEYTLTPRAIE